MKDKEWADGSPNDTFITGQVDAEEYGPYVWIRRFPVTGHAPLETHTEN